MIAEKKSAVGPGKKPPANEKLIDLSQAAKLVGVHRGTLYRFARNGTFPAIRIGGTWRVRPSSIEKWLDELERERSKRA